MSANTVVTRVNALVANPFVDRLKTALFLYVILTRVLKLQRHLRARGIASSINEFITSVKYVRKK